MARRKYKIIRIAGWIIAGFISLILIITLTFYLGRGWIMNRAVTYLNEQQPGEVQLGKMNLIPFANFPNVSLQLRNMTYYEREVHPDSLLQEPILSLYEVLITLDVIDLIKGDIVVSQASTKGGFVRIEIYEDSVSNVERALGIRFGQAPKNDSTREESSLKVDMDHMEVSNLLLIVDDRTKDDHLNLTINQLASNLSYHPDKIVAGIKLNIEINSFKYLTYSSETRRNIEFESNVLVDQLLKKVDIEPSSIKLSELELETWGSYSYINGPNVDLAFRASNKGLEVLNFLFLGILDLDEIEQVGSGSIFLSGNVNGPVGDQLPIIRLNGTADNIGFRIKSLKNEVREISFNLYATNGKKQDLSEGIFLVDGFTATFPEGRLNANLSVNNLKVPEVNIDLLGDLNLQGMEQMISTEYLDQLTGQVHINGNLSGVVNRKSGEFLNDTSSLYARLSDVGFEINQDSSDNESIKHINGELYLEENTIGLRNLSMEYNGNQMVLDAKSEDLLLYLLDFKGDVSANISMASEILDLATMLKDTTISNLLGDELRGLHFNAEALVSKEELDEFLQNDSIPEVQFYLDSFEVQLPVYADISNMNASVTFGPDSIDLKDFNGTIGQSDFKFSGLIANYSALKGDDSTEQIELVYNLSSELLLAEDLLMFDGEFLIPDTYQSEYLKDFDLAGDITVPVEGFLNDSASMNFALNITDLNWNFRYYPLTFEEFLIQIRRKGDLLFIDKFQGHIGESDLNMTATIGNFSDSIIGNMYGNLVLASDLLDFNELLKYQLPEELQLQNPDDTTDVKEPIRLDQLDYPEFSLNLNIGEFRYDEYKIFGFNSQLRSTRDKMVFLDTLVTSATSGGSMEFSGQFNFSNPLFYTFNTEFDLEDVNIKDLKFDMQSGDEIYTLQDNFKGLLSTRGMAEIFITPDFKFDMSTSTAIFNVKVKDGALINFTPLQAASKFLDNKDLNNVKFATLQNYLTPFTLIDSRITIPMMNVESTVGQLLIEGEQGLDNSYLYLLRVPTWLVKGAARSMLSNSQEAAEEAQIQQMKSGNFMRLTAWGNGKESEVKMGDKRDKYQ